MSPSKGKKETCFKPPPSKGTGVICDPTPGSCATLPVSGVMCDPTNQNSMERSTFSTHTRAHVWPYLTSVWRIPQVFPLMQASHALKDFRFMLPPTLLERMPSFCATSYKSLNHHENRFQLPTKILSTTFQRKKPLTCCDSTSGASKKPKRHKIRSTKSSPPNFCWRYDEVFLGVLKGCWVETPSFYYLLAVGVLFLKR